jgi:hypothetical protein
VGFVLQVEQAQQNPGQVRSVRGCGAEQVRRAAMVIAAMTDPEPGAADSVRCGDAGQHCEAGSNVQVLLALLLPQNQIGNLQVSARGLEPGPGISHGACGSS